MNITILTKYGDGLGLAHRLASEGHQIAVYGSQVDLSGHSGIFDVVDHVWPSVKSSRFVVADTPQWSNISKRMEFFNRTVIGDHPITSMANTDHYLKHDLFRRAGMPIPETKVFDDISMTYDELLNNPKIRVTIRYDDVTMKCEYRDWISWAVTKLPMGKKVLFQEPVQGMDVTLTGWYDGFQWLDAFGISPTLNSEIYKYSMIRSISQNSKLIEETILKLEPFLKKIEYHGPVNLNVTINKAGSKVTDVYFGLTYPLSYTLLDFVKGDLGAFFHGVAQHSNYAVKRTQGFVAAVQSKSVGDETLGVPIIGINEERLKHTVFHHVSKLDNDYVIARERDVVLTATAFGNGPEEAVERVYNTAENLRFPERHFDSTLLGAVKPTFEKLKEWKII